MINERIKETRLSKGFTQKELAEKISVSQKDISRWENGERTPGMENIINLCEALEVSADYLLGIENKIKMEEVKMKKYDIFTTSGEFNYKRAKEIERGCTVNLVDSDPEKLKSFNIKEEALEELKKYTSEISQLSGATGTYYLVKEFYVEENEYDEDGEWVSGGDVWEYSKIEIKVLNRENYEVIEIFDNMTDAMHKKDELEELEEEIILSFN